MVVNKSKCGILNLNSRVTAPDGAQLDGYPRVSSYKYLGTVVNNQFTLKAHLNECARKVTFLRLQLRPILLRGHFKLNLNLFKVFAMPQYRMLLILSRFVRASDVTKAALMMRKHFKEWNLLPRSTSTAVIETLLGNSFEEMAEIAVRLASVKRKARSEYRRPRASEYAEAEGATKNKMRKLPNNLLKLLRVMYSSKCQECSTLANTSHLRE